MSKSDENFVTKVTDHICELGWCGFEDLGNLIGKNPHSLAEIGYQSIHMYVSEVPMDKLKSKYDYLASPEVDEDDSIIRPYSEIEEMYLVMDALEVDGQGYSWENSYSAMSTVRDLFIEFCGIAKVEVEHEKIYLTQYEGSYSDPEKESWMIMADMEVDDDENPIGYETTEDSDFIWDFTKWMEKEHKIETR